MKIVIASDSFKGSMSSVDVAQAAEKGIHEVMPDCQVVAVNVADGGEGTVEAIVEALGGIIRNPLHNHAFIVWFKRNRDRRKIIRFDIHCGRSKTAHHQTQHAKYKTDFSHKSMLFHRRSPL